MICLRRLKFGYTLSGHLNRKGNRCEKSRRAQSQETLPSETSGCRSEVFLRTSFYIFTLTIAVFANSVLAQGPSEPRPILVDVIGSRAKAVKPVRYKTTSSATVTLGSANDTEARAFDLMNAQRQASGLQSLQWDEEIVALARTHSQSMAAGKFFSHKDANGGFVDDRAAKLGIFNWLALGENIAFMKGYDDPATIAVDKWMQSTSHKKNILSSQWRESAIGVAVAADGSVYFTQVFISR